MTEVLGAIDFKTEVSLTPDDPEEYLLEIEGRIHTIDENDREVELRTVTGVLVQFQKAIADEVPFPTFAIHTQATCCTPTSRSSRATCPRKS